MLESSANVYNKRPKEMCFGRARAEARDYRRTGTLRLTCSRVLPPACHVVVQGTEYYITHVRRTRHGIIRTRGPAVDPGGSTAAMTRSFSDLPERRRLAR